MSRIGRNIGALTPPLVVAAMTAAFWTGTAAAHADHGIPPEEAWSAWVFDPIIIVPLMLALWLYALGRRRLSPTRRRPAEALAFTIGAAMLVLALVSPVDALGETLLSFHMVQHMLLVAVAPPLLLLGRPGSAFRLALPEGSISRLASHPVGRPLVRTAIFLTGLVPATVVHALALWLWHAPPLFEAALENEFIHTLEHMSFFGAALLFWFAVLGAGRVPRTALSGALASFITFLHSGMLGGILSLAPVPLYPAYGDRPTLWRFDLLTDQQLAGAIMWVPIGPAYLAAALWLLFKVLKTRDAPA
ncbi:cytochrome c oxidase assembly protein [Allosphingosinicella sp.]|uniref:cytochrome c oxidase assembly protein n=1 Tax=Allosphingosinicella sp. TaxID=2823234 RepID=UPI002FC110F1